jgi:glucokinase
VKHAVGIDLGGTELRVGVVAGDGSVLARETTPTDVAAGSAAAVRTMAEMVRSVATGAAPVAIGLCAPGPLDAERGVLLTPPTLPGWDGAALTGPLAELTGLPVTLDNDGHAAAYGEWRHGAGRGMDDFVYITVSTGIGGGVVSGGRLLRGRLGLAGHVGHMTVSDTSEPCACGNRGCWEALASGTALGRAARAALRERSGSLIAACAGTAPVTARHVGQAAAQGDALAQQLLHAEARWLGIGIVNLLHLFSPRRVVVGGGVSALFDLLEPGIREVIQKRALPHFRAVDLARAELGDAAGMVGAACLALDSAGP